jgi:hypothetical protein
MAGEPSTGGAMRWWPLLLSLCSCSDYELTEHKDPPSGDSDPPVETQPPEDSEPPVTSCDDFEPPEPYEATRDETCFEEAVWTPGSFDPVIEWQWDSNPTGSGYDHIMAAPAIGNLTDDNGDLVIDADDIPDIVFTTFAGSAYTSAGALNFISGDGTGTWWSKTEFDGYHPHGSGGVAVADLEGDGRPEILVAGIEAAVLVIEANGSLKWAGGSTPYGYGCPAVADMDGDGLSEVIFGHQIMDWQGNTIGEGSYGNGGIYMSFAVDMDADGVLEVVAGDAVYEMDGSLLWANGENDGIPAVADFDADGLPEVVTVTGGYVTLVDTDGSRLWQTALPGGGSGGAPTVADFDGDGQPEVGVAGLGAYTMFDGDGSVVWSNPTEDDSSSRTGSAVFDFEGDGVSEVVYADEHNLFIYSGPDGAILLNEPGHASGTLFEYPLIADVDNDGSTEIVLASNDYGIAGWQGITVIGDLHGSWAPARPVWNQYAYHITNVDSDLGIPSSPDENWASWNNFRAAGSEQGPPTWKPDLAFGEASFCLDECRSDDHALLWLPVENRGLVDAGGFMVRVYQTGGHKEIMVHSETVMGLATGETTILGPITIDRATWGPGNLTVRLDEPDAVAECDHQVNERDLGTFPCP